MTRSKPLPAPYACKPHLPSVKHDREGKPSRLADVSTYFLSILKIWPRQLRKRLKKVCCKVYLTQSEGSFYRHIGGQKMCSQYLPDAPSHTQNKLLKVQGCMINVRDNCYQS